MPFLVLIIVALFAGVELFQWLKGVVLPLPIYVLAGAFLAIASNYSKGLGLLLNQGTHQAVEMAATVDSERSQLAENENISLLLEEPSKD